MRPLRTLGLVLVVAAAGLFSGAAAGGASTTGALVTTAGGLLPTHRLVEGRAVAAPADLPAATVSGDLPGPAQVVPVVGPAPAAVPALAAPAAAPSAAPAVKPAPKAVPKAKPKPVVQAAGTPCRIIAGACVDLSTNRAWLIRNGKVSYGPVPITHGRKGFRTPPGTFRVSYKKADHVSTIYDAEMPYSVFFNGGIAFHQGSLKQLSHGCIHLSGKAARTFFGTLDRGDVVQVVR